MALTFGKDKQDPIYYWLNGAFVAPVGRGTHPWTGAVQLRVRMGTPLRVQMCPGPKWPDRGHTVTDRGGLAVSNVLGAAVGVAGSCAASTVAIVPRVGLAHTPASSVVAFSLLACWDSTWPL